MQPTQYYNYEWNKNDIILDINGTASATLSNSLVVWHFLNYRPELNSPQWADNFNAYILKYYQFKTGQKTIEEIREFLDECDVDYNDSMTLTELTALM